MHRRHPCRLDLLDDLLSRIEGDRRARGLARPSSCSRVTSSIGSGLGPGDRAPAHLCAAGRPPVVPHRQSRGGADAACFAVTAIFFRTGCALAGPRVRRELWHQVQVAEGRRQPGSRGVARQNSCCAPGIPAKVRGYIPDRQLSVRARGDSARDQAFRAEPDRPALDQGSISGGQRGPRLRGGSWPYIGEEVQIRPNGSASTLGLP